MLGTPLPDKKSSLSNDVLMLDEPLGNQPELSLAGLGLEPQAEVINLTEPVRKPTPAQPAEKDAPIPDLFGDARPAPQPGPRSLLDEAACLAPCGQGSRPTASTNELAIDDIVELGVPVRRRSGCAGATRSRHSRNTGTGTCPSHKGRTERASPGC